MKSVFKTSDGKEIKKSTRLFTVCSFEVPVFLTSIVMEHEKKFGRQNYENPVAPKDIMTSDGRHDYRAEEYIKYMFWQLANFTTDPIFLWSDDEHEAKPSVPSGYDAYFLDRVLLCRTCKVLTVLPTGMGARIRKMAEIVATKMVSDLSDFFLWDLSSMLMKVRDMPFLWVCDRHGTSLEFCDPSARVMDAWVNHVDKHDDRLMNSILSDKNNSYLGVFLETMCHDDARYFYFDGKQLNEVGRSFVVAKNQQLQDAARAQFLALKGKFEK